jgi:hypothetical protein
VKYAEKLPRSGCGAPPAAARDKRWLKFWHTARTVAGGAAFVEAARMQEAVSCAALDLLGGTTMIKPEDLTDEMIAGYFGKHCACRPLDIERASHSHDCDDDPCEDARVALGGRPNGCGYRSTVEAIIHTQAAKRRICDDIIEEGSAPALLAALGKQLIDKAAKFKEGQHVGCKRQ